MESNKLFDRSEEYNFMLNKGLSATGEDKYYFAENRIRDLSLNVPKDFIVRNILDFGCGIGDSCHYFLKYFTNANVVGIDTSSDSIAYANQKYSNDKIQFYTIENCPIDLKFDLCFVNGVFHHITPENRIEAINTITMRLNNGALLAIFENNPLNPGTRYVMSKIPFDADAIKITHWDLRKLIKKGGYSSILATRFLFMFPSFFKVLRPLEKLFAKVPLGGQYYILAKK